MILLEMLADRSDVAGHNHLIGVMQFAAADLESAGNKVMWEVVWLLVYRPKRDCVHLIALQPVK
jgi:hypothetical protein